MWLLLQFPTLLDNPYHHGQVHLLFTWVLHVSVCHLLSSLQHLARGHHRGLNTPTRVWRQDSPVLVLYHGDNQVLVGFHFVASLCKLSKFKGHTVHGYMRVQCRWDMCLWKVSYIWLEGALARELVECVGTMSPRVYSQQTFVPQEQLPPPALSCQGQSRDQHPEFLGAPLCRLASERDRSPPGKDRAYFFGCV